MNYAKMMQYDTSNWEGITATIFFSGCRFKCLGCFNPELHNFEYGKKFDKEAEKQFIKYAKNKHVDGICLLGGEVFQQNLDEVLDLVCKLKREVKKPIHVWSGYTFEELMKNEKAVLILHHIDTLVDGRFMYELKDLTLRYRGSSNQRVIDVKKTLEVGEVVLIDC